MTRMTIGLAGLLLTATAFADVWGSLEPGGYGTGFETRYASDEFRAAGAADAEDDKRLQISIWFPAADVPAAAAMSLRDYVHLTALENAAGDARLSGSQTLAAEAGFAGFPLEDIDEGALERALDLPVRAVQDAEAAAGRFPLLVVIPGNHDPAWRHFVLAEYLASHGYVVASFPSASRRVRDAMTMDFGFGPFRDQMVDAAFVTDYLRAEVAAVDPDRLMLFGFSIGGNTGGFNLLRDRDVSGFVCLDCGIGSTWGTPYLNAALAGNYPAAANRELAFLHISEGGERNDDSFIDAFPNATAYHAIVEGARHFNFTSLGAIAAELPDIGHESWLASGEFAREVHDVTVESVRLFLDAELRDDPHAKRALMNRNERSPVVFHKVVDP